MATSAQIQPVADRTLAKIYERLDDFEAVQFLTRAPLVLRQKVAPFVRAAIDYFNVAGDEASVHLHLPAAVAALTQYRALIAQGEIVLGPYAPRTRWETELSRKWQTIYRQLAAPDPSKVSLAKAGPPDSPVRDAVRAPSKPDPIALDLVRGKVTDATSPAAPTWGTGVEFVDPRTLCDHPAWRQHLGFGDTEEEEQLTEFVREHTTLHPFIITGDGCASPPDTILDGHRGRRAAMDARVPLVPVVRRTDLTAEAEETLILKSALASKHVRRLLPSKVFALEERLYALYSHGSGHRTDLGTCVGSNAGSSRRPDTVSLVARETGQSRNAVANRRKVFGSPIASKQLKGAVDAGKLSLTAAADLVRQVESDDAVQAAVRDPSTAPVQLERARQDLDARLKTMLGLRKAKPEKKPPQRRRSNTYQLPLDCSPVKQRVGRRTIMRRVVQVTDTHVLIEEIDE